MKTVRNTYRVAGITHHEDAFEELGERNEDYGKSAKALIDDGMEDERIYQFDFDVHTAVLQPDPNNEYDQNAIKVLLNGILVGFVARGDAKHIRAQLEAGNIISVKADAGGGLWRKPYIDSEEDAAGIEEGEDFYWAVLTIQELVEDDAEGKSDQRDAELRHFYCQHCGAAVSAGADFCPSCGRPTGHILEPGDGKAVYKSNIRETKSRLVAAILCFFLGGLGAHRFYTGRYISAVLYILTFGVFGIGTLIDFFVIIFGAWTDKNGYPLE